MRYYIFYLEKTFYPGFKQVGNDRSYFKCSNFEIEIEELSNLIVLESFYKFLPYFTRFIQENQGSSKLARFTIK